MQFAHSRSIRRVMGSTLAGAVLLGLGGCPVPQVPRTPANENANVSDSDGGGLIENANTVGGRPVRPIPSVPVEGVGDGGTDQPDDSAIPSNDLPSVAPLSVSISNFAAAVNVLPGTDQQLLYEVVGGRVEDGPVNVQLYVDKDGIDGSGDEIVLLTGLPVRGAAVFSTGNLPPGRYKVAVKASNQRGTSVRYAVGQLELVGEALVQFTAPAGNVRARPTGIVPIEARIDSLAQTLSWSVFTDSDTTFNGNERIEFSGGGAVVRGSILLQGLPHGSYYIGVRVVDSLGQEFIRYSGAIDCASLGDCRQISIDGAPSIEILEPLTSVTTLPGDQDVRIVVRASDPEANAVVTIFRDVDGQFDGDEFMLQSFQLSALEGEFEVTLQTAGLFPASYHIGASVSDGAGPPVAKYSTAKVNVVTPPLISGTVRPPVSLPPNDPDRYYGRNTVTDDVPVGVNFNVGDPEGVLALQPTGIALEYYLDANSDGVPDAETPLLTVRSNMFRAGPNRDLLDLESLNLATDEDLMVDVLARVVLTDRNGIQVKGEMETVARLDAQHPVLLILQPDDDHTLVRSLPRNEMAPATVFPIEFVPFDNDPVTHLRALLVPLPPEDGGPPIFFSAVPLNFETDEGIGNKRALVSEEHYSLLASQPAAPAFPGGPLGNPPVAEGKYRLVLQVEDSTGTHDFPIWKFNGEPVVITVVP